MQPAPSEICIAGDDARLQKGKGVWELQSDLVPKTATAYVCKIGGGI